MRKITNLILAVATIISFMAPVFAATAVFATAKDEAGKAACEMEEGSTWDDANHKCITNHGTLTDSTRNIINIMLFVIGILCVIMIIFGGFKYVTSSGDKQKIDTAKNTILYAVVGLVVAILAWALVNFVFTNVRN